ncbi:DeoR/GlpR family DNA-binding transcription regulator [Euzebya sp.]|uniref:DeoR/GlpR family DNA-binding transcription regulator n=1 Tax=Euzebya sp. TaxID=1971409 RepID=UPI003516AA8F
MYAEERQRLIADRARRDGRVEVTQLAEELDVTPETIRRDLTRLERLGQLKRVHGGAIPLERLSFEPDVEDRGAVMTAEKERIAKRAVAELPDSGSILLDAGTTTARLAANLPSDRELTVVTNALDIAVGLASRPNLTVLVIGGRVRGRTLAAVDSWAAGILRDLFVDVAFMATNGVSLEHGLTTPDPTEAATKRAMIASARRSVLLADHTKVGNDHLVRFGDLGDIDTFITDTGLDAGLGVDMEALGIEVVRA